MTLKMKLTAAALSIALIGGGTATAVYANNTNRNHLEQHLTTQGMDRSNFSLEDFDVAQIRELITNRAEQILSLTDAELEEKIATHLSHFTELRGNREALGLNLANLELVGLDLIHLNPEDFNREDMQALLLELLPEGFDIESLDRENFRTGGFHQRFVR